MGPMTYMVLEIQELNGAPVVVQQPVVDPTDMKQIKALALTKAAYWTNPPAPAAGTSLPPRVTITAINVKGVRIPGYTWDFEFEQPVEEQVEENVPEE